MGRSPSEEILRANRAFYEAFARGDIEAMDELWARHTEVACIHPGWPALRGRDDVMEGWRAILLGGAGPRVACRDAQVVAIGDSGFVTCQEIVDDTALVATNVFAREGGLWQIVHHHAGPVAAETEPEPGGRPN